MYTYLIKGAWSIFSSGSLGYYYDWMGVIDMMSGINLIFIYYKIPSFNLMGFLMIIKASYSLLSSIILY